MEKPSVVPPPPLLLARATERPMTGRPKPGDQLICFDTPDDEVRYACRKILAAPSKADEVYLSYYAPISSVLQYDKVCGLVALEMALSMTMFSAHPTTEQLLSLAKQRKYTLQGEMFSVDDMADLAREVFGCKATVFEMGSSQESVLNLLCHVTSGNPLLLPYDVGPDNLPACLNGKKAHWAVITGAVLRRDHYSERQNLYRADAKLHNLFHYNMDFSTPIDFSSIDTSRLYLLGKQGKSRYLGAWAYDELVRSNENLREYPAFIAENPECFKLPNCGIKQGLASKVIMLSNR